MWPPTIFCLKSQPIPIFALNRILVKKKIILKMPFLVRKMIKTCNFTVEVNFLLEGRKIRKMGDYGIFIEVFHVAGAMSLSSICKASGPVCVSNCPWDFTVDFDRSFWDVEEKETYWPLKSGWSNCSLYCQRSCFRISVEVFNRKDVQESHVLFLHDHWELPYLTIWEVL